jgi:hypothetical protein
MATISKHIGLYKELKDDEEVLFESKIVTPVVFLKEAESKQLGRHTRQEVPISVCQTNIYMTNERLLFLVLYQLQATELVKDKKQKSSKLSGVSGSWFEIPRSAVQNAEMRPLKLLKGKEVYRFFKNLHPEKEDLRSFLQTPSLELIYDEQEATGRIKDYTKALLNLGFFGNMFTTIEKTYDKIIIVSSEAVSLLPSMKSGL